MAAPRADVLLRIAVIFATFCVKRSCFITPDGISITLRTADVYDTNYENFINSTLWVYSKYGHLSRRNEPKFSIYCKYSTRSLLCILILLGGDIHPLPGPTRDTIPELENLCKQKGFSLLHQNMRGLFSNKRYIEYILNFHNNVDIITLSETHISSTDGEVYDIPGYKLHMKNRTTGPGGGVGAYVNKNLSSISVDRRKDLEFHNLELMWLEIQLKNTKNFLLGVIYRPPDTSDYLPKDFNKIFTDNLSNVFNESKEVILMGDVNVNYLDKHSNKEFKSVLNLFGLKQLIKTPTRITEESSTLIDIIATTHHQYIKGSCTIPSGIADHEMVGCVRKVNHIKYKPKTITCRDYRNYNPESARNDLKSKDWNYFYSQKDVNTALKVLDNYLLETIDNNAPKITRKIKGKPCPWMTPELKNLMSQKNHLLRKSRKTKKEIDISAYKNIRNRVNILVRRAVSTYNKKLVSDSKANSKKFWSAIKSIYNVKGTSELLNCEYTINGVKTSDNFSIANGFCSFFSTVISSLKQKTFPVTNFIWRKHEPLKQRTCETFIFNYVSKVEVESYLKSINRNKATGMDDIPAGYLKDMSDIISRPLSHLINMSLQSGAVPTQWKIAKVTPLFKSGVKDNFDNYRPISVLPIASKIMEKAVHKQLMSFLEKHTLLSNNQFGFRSKKSTELATTLLLDNIRKSVDKGNIVGAIFVDFTKAFDSLSHAQLISKLKSYGIRDIELTWFIDYLFGRKQTVSYNCKHSNLQSVTNGVPQGSILGPLLFVLYLNDAIDYIKHCQTIHYADDTVIYYAGKSLEDIENKLSHDFNFLSTWCEENELLLNLKKNKTEVMLFGTSRRLASLPRNIVLKYKFSFINVTSSYKYLGVEIDSHLNMNSHFEKTYRKASGRLNLLAKLRNQMDTTTALMIYNSMILPVITYCNIIQLKETDTKLKKYMSFEKRAIRIIEPQEKSNIHTIKDFRKRSACEFVRRCIDNNICSNFHQYFQVISHSISTRNNNSSIRLPAFKTEYGRQSTSFLAGKIFNDLPIEIRAEPSFSKFLCKLKKHNF